MEKKQHTIVVGVIKNEKGEILLGKRNQPNELQEHDKWEFPGGTIDFGEDPETALHREIREEASVDVKIIRLLPAVISNVWYYDTSTVQIFILAYECEIIKGEPKPGDEEVAELKFFRPEEIDFHNCLPKTKEIIEMSIKG